MMFFGTKRSAGTSRLMGVVGTCLLSMACGTPRQVANVSAFNDAETACRPNLETCASRCRSGDRNSCLVLTFLMVDDDPEYAELRRRRGEPPLTLEQLEKLRGNVDRLCSDGNPRACNAIDGIERKIATAKIPPKEADAPKPKPSVRASAKATGASPAKTKCDPLQFVSPQEAYVGQEEPYGTSLDIPDLDGDGIPEVEVDYATSMTSFGMTILKRMGDSSCFVPVYSGPGSNVKPRATKTHGWLDVDVGFDTYFPKSGRGYGGVHMTYDGIKYRWKDATECAVMDGTKVDSKECAEAVESHDPDRPPPGR
jgi:hypothetical protein